MTDGIHRVFCNSCRRINNAGSSFIIHLSGFRVTRPVFIKSDKPLKVHNIHFSRIQGFKASNPNLFGGSILFVFVCPPLGFIPEIG